MTDDDTAIILEILKPFEYSQEQGLDWIGTEHMKVRINLAEFNIGITDSADLFISWTATVQTVDGPAFYYQSKTINTDSPGFIKNARKIIREINSA